MCIPVCYDLLYAVTCVCVRCMPPYLHLAYSHALLCEHSQRRVRPPGPHHVHGEAAVLKLLFGLEERVSVEPDVSLREPIGASRETLEEHAIFKKLQRPHQTLGLSHLVYSFSPESICHPFARHGRGHEGDDVLQAASKLEHDDYQRHRHASHSTWRQTERMNHCLDSSGGVL